MINKELSFLPQGHLCLLAQKTGFSKCTASLLMDIIITFILLTEPDKAFATQTNILQIWLPILKVQSKGRI